MSESREKRTTVEDTSNRGTRPSETQYRSVVHRDRGMSGGSIAALVIAAVAAAVVITMLILNNQQRATEQELADERAENAQQPAAQPSQQPPVVVVPETQPTLVPVPVPTQPSATPATPSTADLEWEVNSKLLDDQDLRSAAIDAKVSGATATLSGHVPSEALKTRAEKIAKTVKGIRIVKNEIVVRPD